MEKNNIPVHISRSCYNCTQIIDSSKSVAVYEWQTREFCSSNCLGTSATIEEQLDTCSTCKTNVSESFKIKLCVRFGSVYEQFCSYVCLDNFKLSHPFCKLCQERILSFMVIYEEEKFCSPFCVSRWGGRGINQIYFGNENPCYICDKVGIHHFEMLKDISVFFCSKQCIAKYNKEEAPIKCVCTLCGCLLLVSFDYFYKNGVLHQFCSRQCSNIYIVMKAEIVKCIACQVRKYCFDMIKQQLPGKVEYYCSLVCLNTTSLPELVEGESSDTSTSCDKVAHPTLKIRSLEELNEGGIIVDIDQESSSESSKETSSQQTLPCVSDDVLKKHLEDLSSRLFPLVACKGEEAKVDTSSSATQFDDSINTHDKGVQVNNSYDSPKGIPVPFPIYIPIPALRYPHFHPSPMVIPVPVAVPIPIPLLDTYGEQSSNKGGSQRCSDQTAGTDDEGESLDVNLADIVNLCGLTDLIPVDEIVIDDLSLHEPMNQPNFLEGQIQTDNSPKKIISDSQIEVEAFLANVVPKNQTLSETTLGGELVEDEIQTETGSTSKFPKDQAQLETSSANLLSEDQIQVEDSPNIPEEEQSEAEDYPSELLEDLTQGDDSSESGLSEDDTQIEVLPSSGLPENRTQAQNSPANKLSQDQTKTSDFRAIELQEDRTRVEAPPPPVNRLPEDQTKISDFRAIELQEDRTRVETPPPPVNRLPKDQNKTSDFRAIELQEDRTKVEAPPRPVNRLPEDQTKTSDFRAIELQEDCIQLEPAPGSGPPEDQTQAEHRPIIGPPESHTQAGVSSERKLSKDRSENKTLLAEKAPVSRPCLVDEESLTCETTTLDEELGKSLWSKFISRKQQDKAFLKKVSNSNGTNFAMLNNFDRNNYLVAFITEILEESDYHPNIIIYTLLCIQKSISKTTSVDSIFLNIFFQRFGKVFYNFLQKYFDTFSGIIPFLESTQLYSGLKIRESMLWESYQLGSMSPSVLLFTVMYFNTRVFKFETMEEHEVLSFKRLHKFSNTRYLKDSTPVMTRSLRYICSNDAEKKIRREIFEDIHNPYKCPFKIQEFYSSKCPTEAILSGNFYFTPILGCCPESKIWFSSRKLPSSALRNMLNLILMVDEVQQILQDFHEDSVLIIGEK